jgi:DNA topoisomerase VI subunit A
MREKDIEAAKSLSEDFVKIHQEWFKELSSMVDGNQKADIQALSEAFGINYLMNDYLPRKLQQQDWF